MAGAEPIVSGMAGRYATALFELALDNKSVDAVKADLEKFDAMIAESPDLHRLVRSPVFGAEEQTRALAAVLDKAGIKGLASNFLKFVATNRRLFSGLSDMEALREHLAIDRWMLLGGSWGATLALAYAERHPQRADQHRPRPPRLDHVVDIPVSIIVDAVDRVVATGMDAG